MLEADSLHATVVAVYRPGLGWRGVMLRGPSGAGKSGLALRLIVESGWRLVADDRAIVWASRGRAFARAPASLAGLIEVRAVGVLPVAALAWCELAMMVDCAADPATLDRIPEPTRAVVAGVSLPSRALHAAAADTPAKLIIALHASEQRPL